MQGYCYPGPQPKNSSWLLVAVKCFIFTNVSGQKLVLIPSLREAVILRLEMAH